MIRTIILHNHATRMLSACIGYILWAYIAQYQTVHTVKTIPICFYQPNSSYTIQAPEELHITVSGKRYDIYQFNSEQSALHIDISSYHTGSHTIMISKENLFLPDTIKLVQLIPSHITCIIEKKEL